MDLKYIHPEELIYETALLFEHRPFPFVSFKKQEDETWICIGSEQPPPPKTAEAHFQHNAVAPSIVNEIYCLHPQWYSSKKPHLPYAPDALSIIKQPYPLRPLRAWILHEYTAAHSNRFMIDDRIDPALCALIEEDMLLLQELLCRIEPPEEPTAMRFGYNPRNVVMSRGIWYCVRDMVYTQSYAIELISRVAYCTAQLDSNYLEVISRQYRSPALRWLLSYEKVGVLLDPTVSDFSTYPILDLAQQFCPMYLPFDHVYRPYIADKSQQELLALDSQQYLRLLNNSFPPRPKRSIPIPYPITREEYLLDVSISCRSAFGDPKSPVYIPEYRHTLRFSETLIQNGYIIVSPDVELCLRHYALTHTKYQSCIAPEVLTFALSRCLPFTIAYNRINLRAFHPCPVIRPPRSPFPDTHPSINSTLTPRECRQEWFNAAIRILKTPGSSGVLTGGGLLARLALELGSAHLVDQLLLGPSLHVRQIPDHPDLFADVCPEILPDLVIGKTDAEPTTSWFPPLEIFNTYLESPFEWTQVCEEWFQERIGIIYRMDSPDSRPLTQDEWHLILQEYVSSRNAACPRIRPNNDTIHTLFKQFRAYGRNVGWVPRKLSLIGSTPEYIRDTWLNTSA